MTDENWDCLVIGAGMAGLTLARAARDAGKRVLIVEKSRAIGGRMATRETGFGPIDHGAQYATIRDEAFAATLPDLNAALWTPKGKDREGDWVIGRGGMRQMLQPLADDLAIRFGCEARAIAPSPEGWMVEVEAAEGSETLRAKRVIVTAPSPQAHSLLASCDAVFERLAAIAYAPCWAGLFAFEAALTWTEDCHRGRNEPVGWISRMGSRAGMDGAAPRYTVHMSPDWSTAHLERDREDVLHDIRMAFREIGGRLPAETYARAHRWRYALVTEPLGEAFLGNDDLSLVAIGDGMLGGRVEAAFLSAHKLALELGWA